MQPQKKKGAIAQLVEQRTENPCVPGSIPGGTTPPFIRAVSDFGWSRLFRYLYPKETVVTKLLQTIAIINYYNLKQITKSKLKDL